jgi:hypothetical protein
VSEVFIQSEQFIATAHALTVGVDQHQDRMALRAADRCQNAVGQRQSTLHAQRHCIDDTEQHQRLRSGARLAQQYTVRPLIDRERVAEQCTQHLIESHD